MEDHHLEETRQVGLARIVTLLMETFGLSHAAALTSAMLIGLVFDFRDLLGGARLSAENPGHHRRHTRQFV